MITFQNIGVELKLRFCNVVADSLAQFGANLDSGGIMLRPNGHPGFVNSLVAADFQSASS